MALKWKNHDFYGEPSRAFVIFRNPNLRESVFAHKVSLFATHPVSPCPSLICTEEQI